MKRTVTSLFCVCVFGLSAGAQDNPSSDTSAREPSIVDERGNPSLTITGDDKSTNDRDAQVTAAIRRALMNDDSLSLIAENVSVSIADEVVTLSGRVRTEAEKMKVGEIARRIANDMQVNNDLETQDSD